MRVLFCILPLLLASFTASATDVYRWVDSKGVVHYSDKPPNKTAKPAKLPPLQTYHEGSTADPFSDLTPPPQQPAQEAPAPRITQPDNQATIRDALGRVHVVVSAELAPGQGLVYIVDGQPQNKSPTQSTSYQLSGIYRGTHTISAEIVDADGKTVAHTKPVTVFMKPPTVHHPR